MRQLVTSPIGVSMALHGVIIAVLAAHRVDAPAALTSATPIDLEIIAARVTERPAPPVATATSSGLADPPDSVTSPAKPAAARRHKSGVRRRPMPMSSLTNTAVAPTRVSPASSEPLRPPPTRPDPGDAIVTSSDSVMHMRPRDPALDRRKHIPGPGRFDVRAAARTVVPSAKAPTVAMFTPQLPTNSNNTGLRPTGAGTQEYDDLTFKAAVSADGRVHFKDKPNLRPRIALPSPSSVGRHVANWYRDPKGVATRDERAVKTATIPILGGTFDVTDWAMRVAGMDPYLYRKAKMMDRTREVRFGMAATWRSEALRDSVAALPRYLDRIWRYTTWTPRNRRRVLFQLWDEAREDGTGSAARSGRAARATIIAFIRKRLPEDSALAYPPAEIKIFDKRRKSRARFSPYARTGSAAATEPTQPTQP